MIDITQALEEKPPSVKLAISSVVLGILSIITWVSASSHMISDPAIVFKEEELLASLGLFILSIILKILAGVFQLILLYSWSKAIENNIDNTKLLFQLANERISEDKKGSLSVFLLKLSQMKINSWAFIIYAFFYVFGGFIPIINLINIPAFVFLAIYLHSLFSVSSELSKLKNTVYFYFLRGMIPPMPEIKERNVVIVALLSVITFTIYWLYLLIKLTQEISSFIEADTKIRKSVIEALK